MAYGATTHRSDEAATARSQLGRDREEEQLRVAGPTVLAMRSFLLEQLGADGLRLLLQEKVAPEHATAFMEPSLAGSGSVRDTAVISVMQAASSAFGLTVLEFAFEFGQHLLSWLVQNAGYEQSVLRVARTFIGFARFVSQLLMQMFMSLGSVRTALSECHITEVTPCSFVVGAFGEAFSPGHHAFVLAINRGLLARAASQLFNMRIQFSPLEPKETQSGRQYHSFRVTLPAPAPTAGPRGDVDVETLSPTCSNGKGLPPELEGQGGGNCTGDGASAAGGAGGPCRGVASLDPDSFVKLFPFHFMLDMDLRVLQAGAAIQRMLPNLRPGAKISNVLSIRLPRVKWSLPCLDMVLQNDMYTKFVLSNADGLSLTGGLHKIGCGGGAGGKGEALVFLGSPLMSNVEEMKRHDLYLSDFPPHEMGPQHVMMADPKHAKARRALNEAERSNAALRETLTQTLETHSQGATARRPALNTMSAADVTLHLLQRLIVGEDVGVTEVLEVHDALLRAGSNLWRPLDFDARAIGKDDEVNDALARLLYGTSHSCGSSTLDSAQGGGSSAPTSTATSRRASVEMPNPPRFLLDEGAEATAQEAVPKHWAKEQQPWPAAATPAAAAGGAYARRGSVDAPRAPKHQPHHAHRQPSPPSHSGPLWRALAGPHTPSSQQHTHARQPSPSASSPHPAQLRRSVDFAALPSSSSPKDSPTGAHLSSHADGDSPAPSPRAADGAAAPGPPWLALGTGSEGGVRRKGPPRRRVSVSVGARRRAGSLESGVEEDEGDAGEGGGEGDGPWTEGESPAGAVAGAAEREAVRASGQDGGDVSDDSETEITAPRKSMSSSLLPWLEGMRNRLLGPSKAPHVSQASAAPPPAPHGPTANTASTPATAAGADTLTAKPASQLPRSAPRRVQLSPERAAVAVAHTPASAEVGKTSAAATANGPPVGLGSTLRLLQRPTNEVAAVLSRVDEWQFDAFELDRVSGGRPLSCLAFHLMKRMQLTKLLNLNESRLSRFLLRIEDGYTSNPYHSRKHAADVLRSLHVILLRGGVLERLMESRRLAGLAGSSSEGVGLERLPLRVLAQQQPPQSQQQQQQQHAQSLLHGVESKTVASKLLACYLAAIVHDYEHKGVNNDFLIRSADPLAIRYNDVSPMENHHLAAAFALIQDDAHAFLHGKGKEAIRKQVIEMVLATDMKQHFAVTGAFGSKFADKKGSSSSGGPVPLPDDNDSQLLIWKMALKCADLGHLVSSLDVHKRWVARLEEELFRQGDRERALCQAVSPLMDRSKTGIQKSQSSFFSIVALPMFSAFVKAFPASEELLTNLDNNLEYWRKLEAEAAAAAAPAAAPKQQ